MKYFSTFLFFFFLSGIGYSQVSFLRSTLSGTSFNFGTSLQFGLDNRLYVAQQDGLISIYKIIRLSPNNYQVVQTETITLIKGIPNHNDNGILNPNINHRLVTGLLVVGTSEFPVIYVSSSDPRNTEDTTSISELDSNSGILSKLTWNGSSWNKLDLVRGLPRSTEVHASNGMQLDPISNILYLAQGGHTNMGAPSALFKFLPEYALSSCVLSIDLNSIGNSTYDLPTLDDEDKPNLPFPVSGYEDVNDPFGGNQGKNMAILKQGSPVQVFASGLRNAYDLLIKSNGKLYTIDNAPNNNYGGPPIACSNNTNEENVNPGLEGLYLLNQGTYCGHGNPTRGNYNNTFNLSVPQHPVDQQLINPNECTYLVRGIQDGAICNFEGSTNGFTEYTAENFNGSLKGELLAAFFNGSIIRIQLNSTGDSLSSLGQQVLADSFGTDNPLDITAQGDSSIFPGTIWIMNFLANTITVLEPTDYEGCNATISNLSITACHSYTASSGEIYTESDSFFEILTNANGCDSIITVDLTITQLDTSIVQIDNNLHSNCENASYQWIDCENGNSPILEAQNQNFTPSFDGQFAVILTTPSCQDTSQCYDYVLTSISSNDLNGSIQIYPNPTSNFIYIKQMKTLNCTIEIRDVYGRTTLTKNINGKMNKKIEIIGPKGIYFVSAMANDGIIVNKKIIKQ